MRDPRTALLNPLLAAFLDEIAAIPQPNELRYHYVWAKWHGEFTLTHPLDMAILRHTEIQVHPTAELLTDMWLLLDPEAHVPPPPKRPEMVFVDGYWKEKESPNLTRKQLEGVDSMYAWRPPSLHPSLPPMGMALTR